MKAMNKSNEHVLAMGACFNDRADSHLVCVQNDDGNYQTQAISIHHQPRKGDNAGILSFRFSAKKKPTLILLIDLCMYHYFYVALFLSFLFFFFFLQ